jgi:hypothetical protein
MTLMGYCFRHFEERRPVHAWTSQRITVQQTVGQPSLGLKDLKMDDLSCYKPAQIVTIFNPISLFAV